MSSLESTWTRTLQFPRIRRVKIEYKIDSLSFFSVCRCVDDVRRGSQTNPQRRISLIPLLKRSILNHFCQKRSTKLWIFLQKSCLSKSYSSDTKTAKNANKRKKTHITSNDKVCLIIRTHIIASLLILI